MIDYRLPGYPWEDLRFPSSGINPPGAVSDPTRSTTTGLLNFSGAADNIIAGVAQMPHNWKEGSTVIPHIHVRFTTAAVANTRWRFEYDVASVGGSFTNHSGTYTTLATITIANANNIDKHVLGSFGNLTMTGHTASANIVWRVSRLASSDAADTDGNACELLDFDIHYQLDSLGSRYETFK